MQLVVLNTLAQLCNAYPYGTTILLRRDSDPTCRDPVPAKAPPRGDTAKPAKILNHIFRWGPRAALGPRPGDCGALCTCCLQGLRGAPYSAYGNTCCWCRTLFANG